MSEWIEYTGSDEQIEAMKNAKHGFIAKNTSEESGVMFIRHNQMFIQLQKEPCLTELFGNKIDSFLSLNNTTHYLICEPSPLADMIKRQVDTGQPVWIKHEIHWDRADNENTTYCTSEPDWNIPGAEYSFTPFDEQNNE